MSNKVLMLLDNPFKSDARVEKEALSLIKAGYSVKVICLANPLLPEFEERNAISIHRFIHPSLYTRPFSKEAVMGSRQLIEYLSKESFEILHCHDYNLVHIGSRLKKIKPHLRLVYDAHEFFTEFSIHRNVHGLFNKLKTFVVWKLLLLREKRAARQYHALLSTTPFIVEKLSEKFNVKKRAFLRNIPEKQIVISTNYLKAFFGFKNDSFVIVHTGNIYFQPQHLLSLYNSLKSCNCNVYLVFFIDNSRSLQYQNFIQKHQLTDLIFFHPYPKKEDILNYLSSADFGYSWVNPAFKSQVYGSPNRFWEYTLAGIPIISNYQWEIDAEIKKSNQGIVYVDEMKGFETSLQQMLSNVEFYKKNASAVAEKNCWETESKKLTALYQEIN